MNKSIIIFPVGFAILVILCIFLYSSFVGRVSIDIDGENRLNRYCKVNSDIYVDTKNNLILKKLDGELYQVCFDSAITMSITKGFFAFNKLGSTRLHLVKDNGEELDASSTLLIDSIVNESTWQKACDLKLPIFKGQLITERK